MRQPRYDELMEPAEGIDYSPLHREIDALKTRLCSCRHEGTCVSCRGFEMLREQAQMVIAAASQPVLLQVAQEASIKHLAERFGGLQEKLATDSRLQELMGPVIERIVEDLGGPEAAQKFFDELGLGGMPPQTGDGGSKAYDDRV